MVDEATENREIVNTSKEGKLTVKKFFPGEDKNKEFSFTVTGPNSFSESFKLKHDGIWSKDLPLGEYKVEKKLILVIFLNHKG